MRNNFFIKQLCWLLLNYILVSENIFFKKSGEIAFELINLFHVERQQPTSRSTTTRAFVFLTKFAEFVITKYLKQEANDSLRVCLDEHSPCGLCIAEELHLKFWNCSQTFFKIVSNVHNSTSLPRLSKIIRHSDTLSKIQIYV